MGKLVPKKPARSLVIPSFEADVHKLIDKFVLKVFSSGPRLRKDAGSVMTDGNELQVQDGAPLKLTTFKDTWRSSSFSFIHQASLAVRATDARSASP